MVTLAKYPPSLAYVALELGLGLAVFGRLDVPERDRPALGVGSTSFYFYLLHVHVMVAARWVMGLNARRLNPRRRELAP